MTEVTISRGPVVPQDKYVVGNLVECGEDDSSYVVLITDTGDANYFGGTVVVPSSAAHSVIGYTSNGFAKRVFKQFVGTITLKV